jgi:hypothetical protein
MPLARDLVRVLLPHAGEQYHLGSLVPKEDAAYRGPWDCAEFVAWGIYQVTRQYVGCRGRRHDAWTGYFAEDLPRFATSIPENEAVELIGAIALRPRTAQRIGHIAICRGAGRTIEAADSRRGVASLSMRNRGFTQFYTLNSLVYDYACGAM